MPLNRMHRLNVLIKLESTHPQWSNKRFCTSSNSCYISIVSLLLFFPRVFQFQVFIKKVHNNKSMRIQEWSEKKNWWQKKISCFQNRAIKFPIPLKLKELCAREKETHTNTKWYMEGMKDRTGRARQKKEARGNYWATGRNHFCDHKLKACIYSSGKFWNYS